MKRLISALLALAVLGAVLTGCSSGSESDKGGTGQSKDTGTTGGQ
jgi:hypothetical protein